MAQVADRQVLLQASNLTKAFPGVMALSGVNFQVKAGEVNALVGENGAGKSTLIKIIAGFYTPDSGEIKINGESLKFTTKASHLAGIATIHQDHQLIPNMSVAENISLGMWETKYGFVSKRREAERAEAILSEILPNLNPRKLAKTLSPAEAQLVEISKALSENSKILVMDEPTSSLSGVEVDRLFEIVEKLKMNGIGIVFVSHWLDEVFKISDYITVLRDGKLVDSVPTKTVSRDEVIRKMVGRDIKEIKSTSQGTSRKILEVRNLTRYGILENISFDVNAGEIVTLAGLEGAGRSEIAECIFGIEKYQLGEILVDGVLFAKSSPKAAIEAGIGLVPEDRHSQAMIPKMSVKNNISVALLKRFTRLSWLLPKAEEDIYSAMKDRLKIKAPTSETKIATLSGGNQQKVVLGRWLSLSPKLLILDEPTKGVDVAAKAEISRIITEMATLGTAVLLISSELPEVLALSDRVIVIRSGNISGELVGSSITQKSIMDLAMAI
jgi:ABC-type sugar transport system ATPase subunit